MQLGPNNCSKFQEQLEKLYSAEICQTETQIKQKEPTKNTLTTVKKKYLQKTPNLPPKITIKVSYGSPIHPPIPKINNSGKPISQIQNQTPKQTMKNQNTYSLPQTNLNLPYNPKKIITNQPTTEQK